MSFEDIPYLEEKALFRILGALHNLGFLYTRCKKPWRLTSQPLRVSKFEKSKECHSKFSVQVS